MGRDRGRKYRGRENMEERKSKKIKIKERKQKKNRPESEEGIRKRGE
jgi:hypothetical protein